MITASDDFIKTMLSDTTEIKVKLELLDKDDVILEEITTDVSYNEINDITVDTDRDIRRQFTITLNNHSGRFTWYEDGLIWINRKKVKLYIGLDTPNGTEYVPQGVFVLTSPESTNTPTELTTVISGQDQWYWLTGSFGRYTKETTYDAYEKDENGDYIMDENGFSKLKTEKDAAGNTVLDQDGNPVYYRITNYIRSILENAGFTKMILDDCDKYLTVDMVYETGTTRGDAIKDLTAKCYSDNDDFFYEAFFDVNGYFRFRKVMKASETAPCWTYEIENGTMYAGSIRTLNESVLFNHILVLGGSNNTAEFRTELIVDENSFDTETYGDAAQSEFNQGTYTNMETDAVGKLHLLEIKEKKTLPDGKTTTAGTGKYKTSGTFVSRWFEIGKEHPFKDSEVNWIEVKTTENKDDQTISASVEFSNDKSNIVKSGALTNDTPLPCLTANYALPKFMRYKITMSTKDNVKTPILTNIKFSVTVNHQQYKNHPYSVQKIGDRMYFWNEGIDSNIDTQSQCSARAKYELEKNLTYTEEIQMDILPNYLHDANDVISIVDNFNGCTDNYQIVSFSLPVKAGFMTINAKKIRKVV